MNERVMDECDRIRAILREHLPDLQARYAVATLSLFGSYVRGEQRSGSDVDLLVTFSETPSLLEFVDLKLHLAGLLGVEVDLVMRSALKPHIGERILDEAVPV